MSLKRWAFLTLQLTVFLTSSIAAEGQTPRRPYRLDDMFRLEEIGAAVFAPDGQALAFTRRRAAATQIENGLLLAQVRDDVWLQPAPGAPARNLTNGQSDSSGWWAPNWSPDGQRLAFLSSRGGNVTLWAWERTGDRVRQLSTEGLDFDENHGGCHWLDAQRLLCLALPEGEKSSPYGAGGYRGGQIVERAEAAWARAKRGEVTASAVSSMEFRLPQRRLLIVDAVSGREQLLGQTQVDGEAVPWLLSPSKQALVHMVAAPRPFAISQRIRMGYPASIEIKRLDGQAVRLNRPLPSHVVTRTLSWSIDGQELAFFALEGALIHPEVLFGANAREVRWPKATDSKEYPGKLWKVNLATGNVVRVNTGDLDLGQGVQPLFYGMEDEEDEDLIQWSAAGELIVKARRLSERAKLGTPLSRAWYALGRNGQPRPIFSSKTRLPEGLQAIEGGRAFVGFADRHLWRFDPAKGTVRNLTASLPLKIRQLHAIEEAQGRAYAVLASGEPRDQYDETMGALGRAVASFDYHLFDLGSGKLTLLAKPAPDAVLAAVGPVSGSAMFERSDSNGTILWRSMDNGTDTLVETNIFLKEIDRGEGRLLTYTSLNGTADNKAFVVLPPGYIPGQRYPLVVDFDIGYSSEVPQRYHASHLKGTRSFHPFHNGLPAAGYIYMFTSAPADAMDPIGRANLLQVIDGILPATEAAIQQGLADPGRVFLYGASSAGYGAFALVTQSSRFKAVVAEMGWIDQITDSLGLGMGERYSDNPFDSKGGMGAAYSTVRLPFWRNADHLRRNSPLSYVDRVQTPLMIIHGDLDGLGNGLTQAELFFSALVQQRKPAEFVRYWGENHGNRTPANIRDRLQRILAWYDQWGDIARGAEGNILFDEKGQVKSRNGVPPLEPGDYAKFPLFDL